MIIKPCFRCPLRECCAEREEFRRRARGLGAVSVMFRCAKIEAALRPGRRIVVDSPVLSGTDPDWDARVIHVPVPATITGCDRTLFTCVVDPGTPGTEDEPEKPIIRFRRRMGHHRIMRFLDEPDMELCSRGRRIQRNGVCDRPRDEPCLCAEWREHEEPR